MLRIAALLCALSLPSFTQAPVAPRIASDWWQVAGNPDLGKLTTPKQQPVDFGVWQAADGTWQLWSCIRHTAAPGRTRLFYRWQGPDLTSPDWEPMGIAMQADPGFGETPGGLQAPHVIRDGDAYVMFYGAWEYIAHARGADGKTFARQLNSKGTSSLFSEGEGNNTRDVMLLRAGSLWYAYYTAYPNKRGAVYARTSRDLREWSESKMVAFGGEAGDGPYSSECPFVYYHAPSGYYFLFRTQRYGKDGETRVYGSRDPLNFGIDDDRYLVAKLPVAAPEIIDHDGQTFMASLLAGLDGIRIARLAWEPR